MTGTGDNDQVFRNWSECAEFWNKHRERRRLMFGGLTQSVLSEASIPITPPAVPYKLLEVAAGPGDASLDLAIALGPNATVWCTDMVPDMVGITRHSATERDVHNARFQECRGEELPFESNFFDAVLCRFGIMFFRDPLQGVREALRVLKPGGRVAYSVWGNYDANPYHHVLTNVLHRYVPGPPADPDAPGAFRYAPAGKLKAIVTEAGAADVREHLLRFQIEAPLTFDQFFEIRTEMSDSLRDKLRKMPPGELSRFKEDVRENAQPYFTSGGCSLPAEVLVVSGASLP